MKGDALALGTRLVHAGEPRIDGAVVMPVFQSATYEYGGSSPSPEVRYGRLNNTPNHRALHDKLADVVDARRPDTWKAALTARTRAFWVETLGNPLLAVADHAAIVAFAREHGLVAVTDNTFATPVNFLPLPFGYDLVIHSATKYLNGHSDVVAGVVAGRADLLTRVGERREHLGGTLDPHACFLLQRGLKTLALRVDAQNRSALALARFLAEHPRVNRVIHPGLDSHPDHERAKELFRGFGGMLSFELAGGAAAAERMFRRLRIPVVGPSLGGVESLISRPAATSHSGLTPDERAERGIDDGLIRLSVGIEDVDDLIADLRQSID